ncbi:MAG TPA: hypothetical protein PKD86_04360 [Gemmatales bacterium]|nr:hypothetical protein [Gemmatales bacterium]
MPATLFAELLGRVIEVEGTGQVTHRLARLARAAEGTDLQVGMAVRPLAQFFIGSGSDLHFFQGKFRVREEPAKAVLELGVGLVEQDGQLRRCSLQLAADGVHDGPALEEAGPRLGIPVCGPAADPPVTHPDDHTQHEEEPEDARRLLAWLPQSAQLLLELIRFKLLACFRFHAHLVRQPCTVASEFR